MQQKNKTKQNPVNQNSYIQQNSFFFAGHTACGILVPWLRTELRLQALGSESSPNHWTTREFLQNIFFFLHKKGFICREQDSSQHFLKQGQNKDISRLKKDLG